MDRGKGLDKKIRKCGEAVVEFWEFRFDDFRDFTDVEVILGRVGGIPGSITTFDCKLGMR